MTKLSASQVEAAKEKAKLKDQMIVIVEQSGQWAWACEDHLHLPSKPIYALPGTPVRLTLMPEAGRDASLLVCLPER